MKSLIDLLTVLLADASRECSVETERDLAYAKSRSRHEGISFLTITLPDFCSDFERSLDNGQVDPTYFAGWRKQGYLPKFLLGFTGLVFNAKGGLKDDASIAAVFHVRQICRFFKKVRIPCSDTREKGTFRKYADLEASFHDDCFSHIDPLRLQHFSCVCDRLWSTVFGSSDIFNPLVLVPRHGPGATAERVSGNAKYAHQVWHNRLDEVFPATEYLFTSINHLMDDRGLTTTKFHEPQEELPVRVISVPKTLKSPRIIAIEPVCMQYTQQAVSAFIVKAIAKSHMTRACIRFTDQTKNKEMALRASRTASHSTIDLSDASDRVLKQHVVTMLKSCPQLLEAVLACRSTRASLPDGQVIDLKKYASMGSALCFPIEAMYFYSVIVHTLLWEQGNASPTPFDISLISKGRYIYGDDIIVPVSETDSVIEGLTLFGCKVNSTKSFSGKYFRESCGMDGFRGVDVTPVYLRETEPQNARATASVLSWVATSNQLHKIGCWATANYMKCVVERVLGKLPILLDTSPGLGWISYNGLPSSYPMCLHTHRPIVRTYKVKTMKRRDTIDGYPALLKFFLRCKDDIVTPSTTDKKHLLFSVRLCTVSRKRTWVPAS